MTIKGSFPFKGKVVLRSNSGKGRPKMISSVLMQGINPSSLSSRDLHCAELVSAPHWSGALKLVQGDDIPNPIL
ncbi:hypothetical protein [Flagellimonas sp.]|uniref:hypothetical protein n=1 Tax=Flagellimonas sp. TaxID=2058762 RepID=UPI003B50974C